MTKTTVFVIRHADAGKRSVIDDDKRPLNERGRAQADGIADRLAEEPIVRVLTSTYRRCVQTIEPLAATLELAVDREPALAEGAGGHGALALIEACAATTVMCSHGDVIGDLLATLDRRGIPLDDDRLAKGSTWALTVVDGAVTKARYSPPPR